MTSSELETIFLSQMKEAGIGEPIREYKFARTRRYRADIALPSMFLLIEIEGGTRMRKSRHTSPKGYETDCIKYNLAAALGWKVFRFTGDMVRNYTGIRFLQDFLEGRIDEEKPKSKRKKRIHTEK